MVKNLPANARDVGDSGWIPGSGRSPGEGNINPFQYSCLGNSMDQGAWGLQSTGLQRVRHNLATKHTHNNNNVFKNSKQSAASTTLLSRYAEN